MTVVPELQFPPREGTAAGGACLCRGAGRRSRAWWREGGGWRASEGREDPPGAVASLPDWALAVGIDEGSCGVYWQESAGPEAVDAIADALTAWRNAGDETPRGASLDP